MAEYGRVIVEGVYLGDLYISVFVCGCGLVWFVLSTI